MLGVGDTELRKEDGLLSSRSTRSVVVKAWGLALAFPCTPGVIWVKCPSILEISVASLEKQQKVTSTSPESRQGLNKDTSECKG